MQRWAVAAVVAMAAQMAWAAPAPFGLEIGKATVRDLKAAYPVQSAGTNTYSGGEMYRIDASRIDFEGLQGVLAIFGKDGTLQAVTATLDKNRFDAVNQGLAGKYKSVSKKLPFVGDKRVVYVDGQTEIELDAPHMSFEMVMTYATKSLIKAFRSQSSQAAQQKKRNEASQL